MQVHGRRARFRSSEVAPGFTAVTAVAFFITMTRYLVYAEGQFGTPASKTGHSVIRYSGDRVVAVLDSKHAGKTVAEVLGFGGNIPIVASIDDGVSRGADSLLVG